MRVAFTTLSAPPSRHIGSELMSVRLAAALHVAGRDVSVHATHYDGEHTVENVRVTSAPLPEDADVIVCHPDYGIRARQARRRSPVRVVAICHHAGSAVKVGLANTAPDLVVVNSESMREALAVDALVVNPPAPEVTHMRLGRHVTALSLNELKGGPKIIRVAERLPTTPFLAVQGGYGDQNVSPPRNMRVLPHQAPGDLDRVFWRHAGIFLQLSESESWGMAAAEAIAHGVPVIAHPTPGVVENLGDAAVYVDRDDIDGIAEAILTIQGNPAPFRAAALARAEQHTVSSRAQITEWVSAIESLGR